jgi:hypothetical protein
MFSNVDHIHETVSRMMNPIDGLWIIFSRETCVFLDIVGGGGVGCEKTPLKVQDYMGYKSTDDPLYKVDKLMVRAAPLVDPDDFENYLEVVEKYKDKADSTAMMAYTSSWGEANPNGGKDVIDEYLDQTKQDVADSERYLKQILGYLKLEPMPASKKP